MIMLEIRGEVTPLWCVSAAAMLSLVIITVCGNAAVIKALRHTRPRLPTHYPLTSLALADFMLGVFVLPLSALRELFLFQPYHIICAYWSTMDVFCCTASILSLCTLGWERWSGITAPLARAKRLKRARLFAFLVWPVSAMVAIPTGFVPTHPHSLPNEILKACTVNTNIGYVFFSMSFSFYIPALVMMVMYTRIIVALAYVPPIRSHRGRSLRKPECGPEPPKEPCHPQCAGATPRVQASKEPNDNTTLNVENPDAANNNVFLSGGQHLNLPEADQPSANPIPSPLKRPTSPGGIIPRQRRATQTIIVLMSVFLVCWWPFFVMLPVDSLCECVSDTTWLVCTWLAYANSALDPLVYAAASPTVRRALQATITLSSRSTELPETARRRLTL